MNRKLLIAGMLCCVVGCGDALDDTLGVYEGTSELYNATNFGMNNQTQSDVIAITTSGESEEQVLIGLSSDCALIASVSEATLTVARQSCTFEAPNSTDTWFYEGTGKIDERTLTLNLGGTFTRVYMAGPLMTPPLEGNHRLDFTGMRQ